MNVTRLKSSRNLLLCGFVMAVSAAGLQPIHAQLRGHGGPVRALAISSDGTHVVSGSFDTSAIRWSLSRNVAEQVMRFHDGPLNAVATTPDGEMIAAGASGKVFFLSSTGEVLGELQAGTTPIIQLAISNNGLLVAAASTRGSVAVIDRKQRTLMHTLVGPGLPVWAVALLPDNSTLLTGGTDSVIRRWNAVTGEPIDSTLVGVPEDPLKRYAGDHGAEVFRACVACHTLRADEAQKAGPTLWHIFGRRIATLPGYNFSPALKKLDI